jgi:hypothetical protein
MAARHSPGQSSWRRKRRCRLNLRRGVVRLRVGPGRRHRLGPDVCGCRYDGDPLGRVSGVILWQWCGVRRRPPQHPDRPRSRGSWPCLLCAARGRPGAVPVRGGGGTDWSGRSASARAVAASDARLGLARRRSITCSGSSGGVARTGGVGQFVAPGTRRDSGGMRLSSPIRTPSGTRRTA